MTIQDDKAALRKLAAQARKQAHNTQDEAAACAHLAKVLSAFSAKTIAGYMPIKSEISPLNALPETATLCMPVVLGDDQPLAFLEWTPGCEMTEGAFGVQEPDTAIAHRPDVVIVPMLAFDDRLFRLGYGGGYYDRTLAQLRADGTVMAIGFAYAAQEATQIPVEPTDQALDLLVTDKGLLWP